jgi:hypothetical protein
MKNLLKVILPPLIGFSILFVAGKFHLVYHPSGDNDTGRATIISLISFFCYIYIFLLLLVIAFFSQLLVIVPAWNGAVHKPGVVIINAIVDLFFICLLFALGVSYAIWDPLEGIHRLVKILIFTSGIQLIYWLINLFVLLIIE